MLKTEDNPPILFPEGVGLLEIAGPWWVAHTKSRNEKALAWWLNKHGVGYFLPLSEKLHRSRGRKYTCMVPLFAGYVFFAGDAQQRQTALASNRIANVIEVVDQSRLVRNLVQISDALGRGVVLDPHPYLKTGQSCRVTAGPLAGLEGIIVRKKEAARLVLQIDMLGQAASVEIDADTIEPLT